MTTKEALLDYVLRLADNNLILGQRLCEWCGHAPELEIDIALSNIALDLMGQSRNLYAYATELDEKGRTEDEFAFLRDCGDFRNVLLVEQPNDDFAYAIVRQFFFDVYNYLFYKELKNSSDARLAEIADKSIKEISYHIRFSSEWVIRLGDGTNESNAKMQTAIDELWDYVGELTLVNEVDKQMFKDGGGVDLDEIRPQYYQKLTGIFAEAMLKQPTYESFQKGGKEGIHTEYLGTILAEMQWMQRAYPDATW